MYVYVCVCVYSCIFVWRLSDSMVQVIITLYHYRTGLVLVINTLPMFLVLGRAKYLEQLSALFITSLIN